MYTMSYFLRLPIYQKLVKIKTWSLRALQNNVQTVMSNSCVL